MSLLKDFLSGQIQEAGELYVKDLEALSAEQLASSPGGVARSPYDFTFEVAELNVKLAARIAGAAPSAPGSGWIYAPEEFKVKEKAVSALASSCDALVKALTSVDEAVMHDPIPTSRGGQTTRAELAALAATHMMYHCGQLNYVQTLNGDGTLHWM